MLPSVFFQWPLASSLLVGTVLFAEPTYATKDDPPVPLWYGNRMDVPITTQRIEIHHPVLGKVLKDKMDALNVPCQVVAAGRQLDGTSPTLAIEFFKQHFGLKK
jgi:hypothetical protein